MLLLLAGPAIQVDDVVVDDPTACIDAPALRKVLPPLPLGTRVSLSLRPSGEDTLRARLEVELPDQEMPSLDRELEVARQDCGALPELMAFVVERFVADLPTTVWEVKKLAGPETGVRFTPPEAGARGVEAREFVSEPPKSAASAKAKPRGRPIRFTVGMEAQLGSGFVGLKALHRYRGALVVTTFQRLGPWRGSLLLELGPELWEPVPLPGGWAWSAGARLGLGVTAGVDLFSIRAAIRAGGLAVFGGGFTESGIGGLPVAELAFGLELLEAPTRVRIEIVLPLVGPRFVNSLPSSATASTPAWLGISIGLESAFSLFL